MKNYFVAVSFRKEFETIVILCFAMCVLRVAMYLIAFRFRYPSKNIGKFDIFEIKLTFNLWKPDFWLCQGCFVSRYVTGRVLIVMSSVSHYLEHPGLQRERNFPFCYRIKDLSVQTFADNAQYHSFFALQIFKDNKKFYPYSSFHCTHI